MAGLQLDGTGQLAKAGVAEWKTGWNGQNGHNGHWGSAGITGVTGVNGAPPLNRLYPTDLREVPPVSDIDLPPPPVVLPAAPDFSGSTNSEPRYFRLSLNVVPTTSSVLKKSKLPFGLVIRPYNELQDSKEPVPVARSAILRCRRCRVYINPFVTWSGSHWRCNFCGKENETSYDYDEGERPELSHLLVEFVAPAEYSARPPQPLVYVFVIDVSKSALISRYTEVATKAIASLLKDIPNRYGTAQVAVMAVDLLIYYIRFSGNKPQMLVVLDLEEPFIPLPTGLLVDLASHKEALESLLVEMPLMFLNSENSEFALPPAIQLAHRLISHVGGKVMVFLAHEQAVGETGKSPKSAPYAVPKDFYKSFAVQCNSNQVSIDMFLADSHDVANLLQLPRFTAGQTHFYPAFLAKLPQIVAKLQNEIQLHLLMETPTEAVLRVRCLTGFKVSGFFGNFFNRLLDLGLFPIFPRDQSYIAEILIEEKISKPVVFFQAAVLHSTSFGERRIRVINLALPTLSKLEDIYASADQLAITNIFAHKAMEKSLKSTATGRDFLVKTTGDILALYRNSLSPVISGLPILTNLRLLPLLLYALSKHVAFQDVQLHIRALALNNLASWPLHRVIRNIYPSVYPIHAISEEGLDPDEGLSLPEAVNATKASWDGYGLYLVDNGLELVLWVGGDAVPALVADVFGVESLTEVVTGMTELPEVDSELSNRLRNIVAYLRNPPGAVIHKLLYVVAASAPEPWPLSVEDGYHEFVGKFTGK